MIHIAGNVSFNGLIYPRSGDGDTNAKLCFEVLEGGATLITRLLCESQAQHNCNVYGPDVKRLSPNPAESTTGSQSLGVSLQTRPAQLPRQDEGGDSHPHERLNVVPPPRVSRPIRQVPRRGSRVPRQMDGPGAGRGTHSHGPSNAGPSPEVSPRTGPAQLLEQGEGGRSHPRERSDVVPSPRVSRSTRQGPRRGSRVSGQMDGPGAGRGTHSHGPTNLVPPPRVVPQTGPAQDEHAEDTSSDAAMRYVAKSRSPSQAEVLYCMSCSVSKVSFGDDLMNAILDLKKADKSESGDIQHYKVEQLRKFDSDPAWYKPPTTCGEAETIVIEGPTATKPNIDKCREWLMGAKGNKFIYKMTRPLVRGPIWDYIRRRNSSAQSTEAELFVIVDANDLRAEGLDISRHLSWESTAQTFVKYATSTHWLHSLIFCPHLIVLFGCEGVIHCKEGKESTLFFDPKNAEGDFASHYSRGMVDVTGAFIAGLASSISKKQDIDGVLPSAIRQGLTSARRLVEEGFISRNDRTPDYPVEQVMAEGGQTYTISSIRIPREHSNPSPWSIFLNLMGDTTEIARFIVRNGPGDVLSRVQTAQFGRLMTADRQEMEGFRAINNLVEEYINGSKIEPLSIGVFGPPGCGKSFALTQVITGAPHPAKVKKLVFNVSQFNQYSDLLSAFQKIRDVVLSGRIPMALFDEFDTSFGTTKLGWLPYFLAPMQDGKFLDQGQTHPLGRSIFVFMGGTSAKFEEFAKSTDSEDPPSETSNPKKRKRTDSPGTQTQDENAKEDFISVKGPDFVSRLRGYVDIRGPDRIDDHDRMYSIRRAILLRALLEQRMEKSSYHLHVDDTVLAGLLKVPKFNHGARSLEAILDMSRVSGRREFERAALPSAQQLRLHVKSTEFMDLVQTKDGLPDPLHENVSRKIKERLSVLRTTPRLSDWGKEILASYDTHTAADDIVRKLRSINRYIVPKPSYPEESLPSSTKSQWKDDEDKRLAREDYERYLMEISNKHESGNASRGPVPWEEEGEDIKKLFIDLVQSIPRIMEECDRRVIPLEIGAPIASEFAPISSDTMLQ